MKNGLPAMILAQPAGFHRDRTRLDLAVRLSDKYFLKSCESFRKIRQQFRGNFALVTARPQNARYQQPSWSFNAQG